MHTISGNIEEEAFLVNIVDFLPINMKNGRMLLAGDPI